MDLRCLVFSSDESAAPLICQALAELGAEAEHCPDAAAAIGRAASESFQIVIADWDEQPNAEFLLKAARGRKPTERPLTLAIVSDDGSVPKALQAGANSVLRKPIQLNQVKDTLETARSLLKAKKESAAGLSSAQNSAATPAATPPGGEAHLRAGDFLTSAQPAPSAQFDTEPDVAKSEGMSASVVDPLKELEPMAAAVTPEPPAPKASENTGPRGLQWYLNQRAASLPSNPPAPMPAPPKPPAPEVMSYDQMAARPEAAPAPVVEPQPARPTPRRPDPAREQKAEAELFSYITHGSDESPRDPEPRSGSSLHLGKRAIAFAIVLAAGAIAAAPQAPWHPAARRLWVHGQRTLHAWLNPQVVEPVQTPETHESFGRAGDEYKLPVAENIPDATTDPSQIRVVPVVDPTAKKPVNNGADPNGIGGTAPVDPMQAPAAQSPAVQVTPVQSAPDAAGQSGSPQPAGQPGNPPVSTPPSNSSVPAIVPPVASSPTPAPSSSSASSPSANQAGNTTPLRQSQKPSAAVQIASTNPAIPLSLRSQMASTVPDASGNKSPDTALPAIEPVAVSETAERALLIEQPMIAYPADAKGQQGTVILQLLVGRDGAVQDAKFLQGSLAFARTAIDGVKAWKFKPYLFNGRPVSVETQLTLGFSPAK